MTHETGPRPVPPVEHVEPVDLIAYSRGELTRGRADEVRLHCADCVACGDQLAALIVLATPVDEAEADFPRPEAVVLNGSFTRKWPSRRIAVGVALGVLGLYWFTAPTEGVRETALLAAAAEDSGAAVGPSELDVDLIRVETDHFAQIFGLTQSVGVGDRSDFEVVKAGVRALTAGELDHAIEELDRFGREGNWHPQGTAMLGYTLYLKGAPEAFGVFDSYVEQAQRPPAEDAGMDLVLYFLARMHHGRAEHARARQLVEWTNGRQEVGRVARAWRDATYGPN